MATLYWSSAWHHLLEWYTNSSIRFSFLPFFQFLETSTVKELAQAEKCIKWCSLFFSCLSREERIVHYTECYFCVQFPDTLWTLCWMGSIFMRARWPGNMICFFTCLFEFMRVEMERDRRIECIKGFFRSFWSNTWNPSSFFAKFRMRKRMKFH